MYSLYFYFLGLSLHNTSKALVFFKDERKSYVSIWNWIQRFGSCQIYNKRKRISAFIIDKIVIQSVTSISGYGFVLNQYTVLCLESTFQRKEICLLLKNSLDLLYYNMEKSKKSCVNYE